jgi:hypothetical protein
VSAVAGIATLTLMSVSVFSEANGDDASPKGEVAGSEGDEGADASAVGEGDSSATGEAVGDGLALGLPGSSAEAGALTSSEPAMHVATTSNVGEARCMRQR